MKGESFHYCMYVHKIELVKFSGGMMIEQQSKITLKMLAPKTSA